MTNSPNSDSQLRNTPTNDIQQKVGENSGQVFGQMIGGIAVGHLTVYLSNIPTEPAAKAVTTPSDLGENPYQGLKAFREADGDRFFGRDDEIQKLLERFQRLHDLPNTVRVLPIYGPSGSGKSSLARAGLIPALGKQPLRGKDRCRVVVLTPGERPLEALATVLARIAMNDLYPVAKTREFQGELISANTNKEFDGLRRIANVFPDINFSPLIILVDQFEEIYTYQSQQDDSIEKIHELEQERFAFVQNLLCAASDRSQNVSVILTLRSDFLGKTQQNPQLNKLFATQGVLVPIMQPDQLAIAIMEPARRAGYAIDKATVNLLIKESQGQEGALPLLQFALMQIWEGLLHEPRVTPAETLEKIGGVGGALASEAKRLYESLTSEQQQIARSAFLSMVQLNDDNKATRRRATISELVKDTSKKQLVREVIECFAKPGVWILVTSSSKEEVEMVEIAHEALLNNWKELKEWLDLQWESLIKKRKIEDAFLEWKNRNKSKDYLLQGRILRDAKEFQQAQKDDSETSLSIEAKEFVKESNKKERTKNLKLASIFLVFPLTGTLILVHFQILARANAILSRNDCQPDSQIKTLLEYMWWTKNADRLDKVKVCGATLIGVRLPRSVITNSDFETSNLSNADFNGAILSGSNFKGVGAIRSNFSNASLNSTDFRCLENPKQLNNNTNLLTDSKSSIPPRITTKAQTVKCSLLMEANFNGTKLIGAKFQSAVLTNARFNGADLTNANFDGVKNLTVEQIESSTICNTRLPSYIKNISTNRDCPRN